MSEDRLELIVPHPAWHATAWRGRMGVRDVLVLCGTNAASSEALASAQQRVALFENVDDPKLVVPTQVVRKEGLLWWIFPDRPVMSMDSLVAGQLPLAAAVEAVAEVTEILARNGGLGLAHRGPTPRDVLFESNGEVRLAGFCTDVRPESFDDPARASDEAALVFRIGVLLSWLTTGIEPETGVDRDQHKSGVRRALIRVMSRPGPVVTERFANLFRSLRAWSAEDRPQIGPLAESLRRIADELGAPSLEPWAAAYTPQALEAGVDELEDSVSHATVITFNDEQEEMTDPSLGPTLLQALLTVDDATQEGAVIRGDPGIGADGAFGMPVRVGPPPGAVRRAVLPAGFLDAEALPYEEEEGVAAPGREEPPPLVPGWLATILLVSASLGLILVSALLLAFLLEPDAPIVEAPRIGELLVGTEAVGLTRVVVVRNPSGASLLVRCGAAETRTTGDAILPSEVDLCSVTAELRGETVTLQVVVDGIVEVHCFDGSQLCERQ